MTNKIIIILFLLFTIVAKSVAGDTCTTKTGYFAATSESDFNKAVKFLNCGDRKALGHMFTTGRVFMVKPMVKVFIEDSSWSGTIKIRQEGTIVSFWTFSEAVK